jgi:excisionase family DNA binding protein
MRRTLSDEPMITAQEVAAALCVSRVTIARAAERGEILGTRIGNRWRFEPSIIDTLKRIGIGSRAQTPTSVRRRPSITCPLSKV